MEAARTAERASVRAGTLAGLQAGIAGVLWLLAWMGLSAVWQRRTFWTAANLMASTFYGPAGIRAGFAWSTVTGLALYVAIYGALGAAFGVLLRDRFPARRTLLLGMVWGVGWYFLLYHALWKTLNPLLPLLYSERPTILGHLIYGASLWSVPRYCRALRAAAAGPAEANATGGGEGATLPPPQTL